MHNRLEEGTNIGENGSEEINTSLYILNEKNILITEKYIENTLKTFGVNIVVKKIQEYEQAMVHPSYLVRDDSYWKTHRSKNMNKDLEPIDDPSKAIPLKEDDYERLEFLGDSVIHLVLAHYLFQRYPKEQEGFMTKLRTKIEKSDTLAHLSRSINLHNYAIISRYIEANEGRTNNNAIAEDIFEAFMGALFLDGGYDVCRKFMVNLMEEEIDFAELLHVETNYKDRLLQYHHKMRWEDPKYGQLDVSGPDHKKMFTMYVKMYVNPRSDGEIVGIGIGSSKKKGEQEAAKAALKHFNVINDSDEDDDDSMEEYTDCSDNDDIDVSISDDDSIEILEDTE